MHVTRYLQSTVIGANKYEPVWGMDPEGARLLTYSSIAYGKPRPRLCINIRHYAPPHIVLHQAVALEAALHAVRRQYSSEGSMSSFESIDYMKRVASVINGSYSYFTLCVVLMWSRDNYVL